MNLLEKAIDIAYEAHRGQKDKYGQPYITHPLRVMIKVNTEEEKIAAVLHDVVEDTDITLDKLKEEGIPENIVTAIDCLTKREGEEYQDYLERAKSNPIAIKVKLADLEDNMDIRRIDKITEKDVERLNKYKRAWDELVKT